MPNQVENRRVAHAAHHMFDLVADVASYPQFLPWVLEAKVYNVTNTGFDADLTVGAKGVSQVYTSRVTLDRAKNTITAEHLKGPFSRLNNSWAFAPITVNETEHTDITFTIDFEIDNAFLRPLLNPFMTQATNVMIEAFEKRAVELYQNKGAVA